MKKLKAKVYNQEGKEKSETTLPFVETDKVKNIVINEYIDYIRASIRKRIAKTKDRSEVRGGGKKPWRQKGTGRARHGSIRSPLWVGGGVTFGPTKERNYEKRLNKKTRKSAKDYIFSQFAKEKRLIVVDNFKFDKLKTKFAGEAIENLKLEGMISLFLGKKEKNLEMVFRNLPYIKIFTKDKIKMLEIASSDYLIFTESALKEFYHQEEKDKEKKDETRD